MFAAIAALRDPDRLEVVQIGQQRVRIIEREDPADTHRRESRVVDH
jgi:hypothetical protein